MSLEYTNGCPSLDEFLFFSPRGDNVQVAGHATHTKDQQGIIGKNFFFGNFTVR